jgi:hypothetical protein
VKGLIQAGSNKEESEGDEDEEEAEEDNASINSASSGRKRDSSNITINIFSCLLLC